MITRREAIKSTVAGVAACAVSLSDLTTFRANAQSSGPFKLPPLPYPFEAREPLSDARTMTEVGTKLDLARAYVDMGDPAGARSILDEVLDEGDEAQRQQAQQLLDSLPS